ncbi:cytochrome b [Stappia sp. F7233]|uniref:Cytochrome b n=1 Tax=Stappia albiluteola TaxID=2758565 RepID=A0A839AA55_9HYPH|nr:cytochrome b [Stappia albiluteola]MBA5775918.1 cytochrome b [Stappia albiluteola]
MTGEKGFVYTPVARLFHWVTAVLVLAMVPAGITMVNIGPGKLQNTLFDFHRSTGVLLFVITFARLLWRLKHPPAPLEDTIPAWQRKAAHATHWLLYAVLLFSPLLGWVATSAYPAPIPVYGLFTLPPIIPPDRALSTLLFNIHQVIGIVFSLAVVVHIAAALHHRLILKDNVLARMTG